MCNHFFFFLVLENLDRLSKNSLNNYGKNLMVEKNLLVKEDISWSDSLNWM